MTYICRECGEVRHASSREVQFRRVVCRRCGGQCDPTNQTAARMARQRRCFPDQRTLSEAEYNEF